MVSNHVILQPHLYHPSLHTGFQEVRGTNTSPQMWPSCMSVMRRGLHADTFFFFNRQVTRNVTLLSRNPSKTWNFQDFVCLPSGYLVRL